MEPRGRMNNQAFPWWFLHQNRFAENSNSVAEAEQLITQIKLYYITLLLLLL